MKVNFTPSNTKTDTKLNGDLFFNALAIDKPSRPDLLQRILFLCCMMMVWLVPGANLQAQVANYTFAASAGSYTPLVGATNVYTGAWDDNAAVSVPLGFTFTFNGVGYTTAFVHPNGYLTFGSSTSLYLPISGGSAVAGVVSAWGRDLQSQNTVPLGSVDYLSSGGIFTVQWSNTRRYNMTNINAERFEMQIQLVQATGVARLVYGTWSDAVSATTTNIGEVGLRGNSGTDFKNLSVLSGGNWATPALGGVNTATCFYNESNVATKPALGQTYTFTPPPPCVAPVDQPTALMLTPSVGSIAGSFTAAVSAPSGYLVVRTLTNVPPSPPVNGTTYTPGTSALGGVIVASGSATTFNATGLSPSTQYFFWIYSFNNTICTGGPAYQTVLPLTGNTTTTACSISGTRSVGPTGFYLTLTSALADLNANGLAGPVILELQSTYLSAAEPAFPVVIPALTCISAVNNLTIRPQAGATALSITSANAAGTLNFDGGDFVTIDGRAGGVGASQLTISNTVVTGYAVQFINNATFNNLKYCTIAGVNTGTTSGVIFFNTSVGFTAGNSNNTIDNCDLRDGVTTPTNLIYVSGSTASYAVQNNNNTVSNSTIHDWFNATSTVASAAINIVGGASDWTISGNSFYQTVTRTFTLTTATDQGAIFVNSALFGSNFTISNNFIGGTAPLCGGTPWTWTGGITGTPTPRLIRFAAALGPFSNISGNTISNLALTTSTTSNGNSMIAHLSGNANITNNTLGSQSTTGNVTFTLANTTVGIFFLPIGFGGGAVPCTVNITDNNLGGITATTSSTGSVSFRVVYGQPVAGSNITINNNLIGGTVANSIQQLTNNIFTGILMLNPTIGGVYTNNTIRNLTLNNTGVTGSLRGIDIQASGGGHTITGNTIFNLTSNATNVAINNAASVVGITMTGSVVGGSNISGNTIYNLTNTNATLAGWVTGMYFSTGLAPQPNTIISKNFVHSLNLSSPLGGMAGIFLPNLGNAQVYNNMVRLGVDINGADITTSLQINGIYKAATGSMNIYHNSVYIGGAGVASGAVNTYAFRRSSSPLVGIDTCMNNIFYNARSNVSGTGKHYAVNLNASSLLVENYNILLANGTGSVLGLLAAADFATLPAWQTGTNQDWNSISSDPKLINPTGNLATLDLHIQPASVTPVEQGGYNTPFVTLDFDLQTRSLFTPVDIGADAGNFLLLDLSAPDIYYTPLSNSTCSTGDRTISNVNITDATGIPLVGALIPRIYYRKNAGTYFSQPGTYVSGPATNSIWNFTIVAADMGGLIPTDVVSYYIIAQDIAGPPNIGSNPAGVIATDVNTVTTHPITPNSYTVLSVSLSGTYTVGVGGNYTTLTAAVAAYNTACLGGPVVFSLTDASYAGETFPITINANAFASSVNTLTIKPAVGISPVITGSSATALIVLNGADWVIIDGSNGFTPNTICPPSVASRDLTLNNTNTGTASAVIWLQTVTVGLNAATNNIIRNVNLTGNGNAQTLIGVGSGSSTISITSLGTLNNNNAYINNNISKTQYGIYSQGSSLGGKNTGTIINQNLINTPAPNNTARGGVLVGFENNIMISGNNISEIALASSPDVFGIAMGGIAITTTALTGNEVTNATVSNNIIGSVRNTGNSFSACGIFVAAALSGTNVIANNMISGVSGNPTPGDFSVGILLGGGNGSTTRVYYNTVTMTSAVPLTSGTSPSFALAVGGVNPVVDIRNNILVNTQNNGSGNNYAVGYGYTPFTNLTSDHNDYFVGAGSTFFIGGTASLATPTNHLTLANLQAATLKDGNGQNVSPVFVSVTDLHLVNSSNQCLEGEGTPIPGITTDIDCQTRNAVTPDIGADEFTGPVSTITVAETSGVLINDGIICAGASATITATGGGTYVWSTGETTAAITVSPVITTTYTVSITNGTCVEILSATITVNPLPTIGITVTETSGLVNNDGTICAGASATLTGTGGTSYVWSTGETTTSITVTPTMTTVYTVTATDGNSCNGTATRTITVNQPLYTFSITNPTNCNTANGAISITMTAGTAPFTFAWTTPNGCGLNPTAQNQTGLCAGSYFMTVTDATGCTNTGIFSLDGPAPGCFSCPTIGSLTIAPGTVCANSTVTLTANGLAGMGVTYGITFKYFTSIPPNPYIGGTDIATVPNASLGGGGTSAQTTTSFATGNTYYIYAILSPVPTDVACRPSAQGTLTVNPIPQVNTVANQTYCVGSIVPSVVFTSNVPGATFAWSRTTEAIGLVPTNGTGNVPSFTATNSTGGPLTSTFTVVASFTNNGVTCTGSPITFTITINPNATVNQVANQTHCAGSIVPSIVFTGNVPNPTFTWTRTNEAIGLVPTSGTGNIPSFTATNTGTTPLTSTFSVVLTFTNNGTTCMSAPMQFTITINPRPTINPIANQAYCAGANVPAVNFTSNVPGVVFNWSRTPEPIGLAPLSGMGSVPTFTGTNPGALPITSTFTATASYTNNGVTCTSAPITFTITINPTPTVNPVTDRIYCVGAHVPSIMFTSNVTGVVFNWVRTGDDIGLAPTMGTGNLPSFTGINPTNGPLVATITVVATFTGTGVICSGPPMTFTITICYGLQPSISGDAYVCPGEVETYINENFNPNSNYIWTLPNGGGVIVQDNGSNVVIDWQDTPGGPFTLRLEESACSDECSAFDFLPVYVQGVETLSCNDHVQISLNENCEAHVLSGMILEGETEGNDNYYVELRDAFGNLIPDATLTDEHIGQLITATVLNECNGQRCSGTISVEDKIKPVIECTDVTVSCGASLEPVFEPAETGTAIETVNPNLPIGPNAGTITTQILTLNVPTNAVVTDVDITIDLNHTWVGDLNVALFSPAGTQVVFVNQLCGAVNDWDNVIFDDQASILVSTACNPQPPALSGSVIPQEALSVINGQSAAGAWTLVVTDLVGGDGGTLNLVSLDVEYYLAVPSAPFTSDACGEVFLSYTDTQTGEDCEVNVISRNWIATDEHGNTSTCTQFITVLPLTLDNVEFPDAYIGVCGESELPSNTGWPTVDGQPITEDNNLCNIFVGYWDKELNDCGGGRKIVRTWTILDWCTVEIVEAVQVIKLVDDVGPELTCPPDYEVGTDFWYCYANVSVPKPEAVDACSEIASYTLSSTSGIVVSFGNNFVINGLELGTHTVTWTVTDECGNSSSCSFEITVVDDVVPVANCDLHTIVSLTNDGPHGITLVPASVFDDGSYDNCGPVTFRARRMDSCIDFDWTTEGACIDDVPGGIPPVNSRDRGTVHRPCVPFACCDVGAGPVMVELEVTDAAGNVNYCMVEATIQDKISPFVECPPDIVVSCDFWFNVEEGTFVDEEGNNDGSLDEDPLSAIFGNIYDAFRYDESVRQDIIINDPGNEDYSQPHFWGIDGWADDNCQVNLQVRVRVVDDCSGGELPGNAPDGAVKMIERRFSASDGNEGVAPGTCTQRIWVVDYDPFYITDNTCNNSNSQDGVIWPCDVLLTTCPEDLGNTGEPTVFDDACSLIGVTYEDTRFDFVDGACFKILREWAIIDWCQYNSQTGEGLWHYTQVIKVHDEEGPEFVAPCVDVVLCVADEGVSLPDNNQAFLGEDNPLSSSCSVHLSLSRTVHETCSDIVEYDVKIYPFNGTEYILIKPTTTATVDENNDAVLSFDTRQSTIQSIRLNGLPYNSQFCGDYHRILWSVEDGCGNWSHCEYLIRLEDCKQPSPVCINGLSTVVMPVGGQVTVWAKDFNASSFDDCTPSDELLYSFSGDTYTPSFTYTCDNVPAFNVELSTQIWVADGGTDDNCNGQISWSERNTDYCTTTIVITDNAFVCDSAVEDILAGDILTEDLQSVELVSVNLNAPGHIFPTYITTTNGQYSFSNLILPSEFSVNADRNDAHRNGVSTLDLVKIQKHLLGIELMNNPYDLIAADANNSESVSAIDLIELRKLILGIYTELPLNQSWRFVDKSFVFADATSPWPFSESITMSGIHGNEMDKDFVAIKVGDVNNSVKANATQILPRNGNGVVNLVAENRTVSAGEIVEVEIRSADFASIEGYQFTMNANGLEFRGVESGLVAMSDENMGVFGSTLTASWHKVGGVSATASDVLFTLSFQATAAGQLSEMMTINSDVTEAEAYNTSSDIKDLKLSFRGSEIGAEFALYQNEPNPFKGNTLIGYDLPTASDVTLTVFDVTGKVVFVKDQESVKGYNTISVSSKDIPSVGVLYYRLDANEYTATKKMIIIE